MKRVGTVSRILTLFLILALIPPSPALGLRANSAAQSGAEEQIAAKLNRPQASASAGMEEGPFNETVRRQVKQYFGRVLSSSDFHVRFDNAGVPYSERFASGPAGTEWVHVHVQGGGVDMGLFLRVVRLSDGRISDMEGPMAEPPNLSESPAFSVGNARKYNFKTGFFVFLKGWVEDDLLVRLKDEVKGFIIAEDERERHQHPQRDPPVMVLAASQAEEPAFQGLFIVALKKLYHGHISPVEEVIWEWDASRPDILFAKGSDLPAPGSIPFRRLDRDTELPEPFRSEVSAGAEEQRERVGVGSWLQTLPFLKKPLIPQEVERLLHPERQEGQKAVIADLDGVPSVIRLYRAEPLKTLKPPEMPEGSLLYVQEGVLPELYVMALSQWLGIRRVILPPILNVERQQALLGDLQRLAPGRVKALLLLNRSTLEQLQPTLNEASSFSIPAVMVGIREGVFQDGENIHPLLSYLRDLVAEAERLGHLVMDRLESSFSIEGEEVTWLLRSFA